MPVNPHSLGRRPLSNVSVVLCVTLLLSCRVERTLLLFVTWMLALHLRTACSLDVCACVWLDPNVVGEMPGGQVVR